MKFRTPRGSRCYRRIGFAATWWNGYSGSTLRFLFLGVAFR